MRVTNKWAHWLQLKKIGTYNSYVKTISTNREGFQSCMPGIFYPSYVGFFFFLRHLDPTMTRADNAIIFFCKQEVWAKHIESKWTAKKETHLLVMTFLIFGGS